MTLEKVNKKQNTKKGRRKRIAALIQTAVCGAWCGRVIRKTTKVGQKGSI